MCFTEGQVLCKFCEFFLMIKNIFKKKQKSTLYIRQLEE